MSAENDAINIVQATGKSYNLRKEVNGMVNISYKQNCNLFSLRIDCKSGGTKKLINN